MADLNKNNTCIGCEYYDCEANDHYYQWCLHPDIDNYKYLAEDEDLYVAICPITNESPYSRRSYD